MKILKSTDPKLEQRIAALKSKKKNFIVKDPKGYKIHYEYCGITEVTNGRNIKHEKSS